jgi:hypothetical protein
MRKYHAPFWSSGRRSDPPIDCNMLALAMLSLPCLGDACTYSVLTRCGTEYRAPQMA